MIPFDSKSVIYFFHGLCWVFLDKKLDMRPGVDFFTCSSLGFVLKLF